MDNRNIVEFRHKPKPPALVNPEAITLQNYDEKALQFAKASGLTEFPTISPGAPECTAWERYFRSHLGGVPHAFRMLMSGQIQAMTVPTQWPEWFDLTFVGSQTD